MKGCFLLTVKLLYLQLCFGAFLLTILELFSLTIGAFYLQFKLSCLEWESASNKHLNGL